MTFEAGDGPGTVKTFTVDTNVDGEDELADLIRATIADLGASSIRDMGPVMNALRAEVQGRADMKAVSQAVKAQLMA